MPADALISLVRNGVNEDMSIKGTKAHLPYLTDITFEEVARFRDQVSVVDLVDPKESDGAIDWQGPPLDLDAARLEELEDAISECETSDPGPYPKGPLTAALPEAPSDRIGHR